MFAVPTTQRKEPHRYWNGQFLNEEKLIEVVGLHSTLFIPMISRLVLALAMLALTIATSADLTV